MANTTLPTASDARKNVPLCAGVLDYFPAALAEVAKVSKAGNDKHNPGEPLHHARGKSMDHADCIARHLLERGTVDPSDGLTHTAHLAWRALAMLQEELEAAGAPLARGASVPEAPVRIDYPVGAFGCDVSAARYASMCLRMTWGKDQNAVPCSLPRNHFGKCYA